MALFDALFNRNAEWYKKRAQKNIKDGDYGQALLDAEKALRLDENNTHKEEIEAIQREIKSTLHKQALQRAKGLIRAKDFHAAQNCIDLAKRYATTDEERESIEHLTDEADKAAAPAPINEAFENNEPAELTDDEKWKLYVSQLSFAQANKFDQLGQSFKTAWIQLQDGKLDDAIKGFQNALEEKPDDTTILLELGRAYYLKKDPKNAEKILTKADHIEAKTEIKLLRAEVLWSMQRFDIAEIVLQAAYDLEPENKQVLAAIAQHSYMTKEFEAGIDAVEVLLDELPNDLSVKKLAARLYEANGDDEKALDQYEAINHLFWQRDQRTRKLQFDPVAADGAANLYFKLDKNLNRAIELLDAIRENTDGLNHVAVCLRLSDIYEKQNHKNKVHEILTEAQRFMDAIEDRSNPMTVAIAAVLHKKLHPEEDTQNTNPEDLTSHE